MGGNQEVELVSKVCLTKISPPPSANRGCPLGASLWLTKTCPRRNGGYGFEMAGLCCGMQRWGWTGDVVTNCSWNQNFPTTGAGRTRLSSNQCFTWFLVNHTASLRARIFPVASTQNRKCLINTTDRELVGRCALLCRDVIAHRPHSIIFSHQVLTVPLYHCNIWAKVKDLRMDSHTLREVGTYKLQPDLKNTVKLFSPLGYAAHVQTSLAKGLDQLWTRVQSFE